MSDKTCLLITLLYENELMKCALKAKMPYNVCIAEEWQQYREFLASLLPPHVRECGPIVDVEEIFELVVIP
jgi:hypothetical protein